MACEAFNLTRAAGTIAGGKLTKATTGTIRRTLINVPARIATSGRRLTAHLPTNWPWRSGWEQLFTRTFRPPTATAS